MGDALPRSSIFGGLRRDDDWLRVIYKLLPRVTGRWHDVFLGAGVTALLFTIGRFLIGLYIGKSGIASGFGAAGSLVIIFVWVYYSAQIFLLGAEFTWVYARTFGSLRTSDSVDIAASATAPAAPTRSDSNVKIPSTDVAPSAPEKSEGSCLMQTGCRRWFAVPIKHCGRSHLRQR